MKFKNFFERKISFTIISLGVIIVGITFGAAYFFGGCSSTSNASGVPAGWTLTTQSVASYPNLEESIYTASVADAQGITPAPSYDQIAVLRLVKTGINPIGVVFILPGTWSNGDQMISNPPGNIGDGRLWFVYNQYDIAYYLANRGFDVYSMDYRTHFVEPYLAATYPNATPDPNDPSGLGHDYTPTELSFMQYWGWGVWISDISKAVQLIKTVSGQSKIFIGGESFGGQAAMNYASEYWSTDLKGIILLDGGQIVAASSFSLPTQAAAMTETQAWYEEEGETSTTTTGTIFLQRFADQYPYYPTGIPTYPNLSDLFTQTIYTTNFFGLTNGAVSNTWNVDATTGLPLTPAAAVSVLGNDIHTMATFDRYWPTLLTLEQNVMDIFPDCTSTGNINCSGITTDFDYVANYKNIDVPLIMFRSSLFGQYVFIPPVPGINYAGTDVTATVLPNYGHLDMFCGARSSIDISEPVYQWLITHE